MADKLDFKRVLDKSINNLVLYLEPDPVLRLFRQYEYLNSIDIRDISEAKTTTEKNQQIIEKVKSLDVHDYEDFKTFLAMTKQTGVLQYLKDAENVILQEKEQNMLKEVFEQVLDKSMKNLVLYLDLESVLPLFTQYELLDPKDIKDISEVGTKDEKIQQIIEKLKSKDFGGYNKFKSFLVMTKQTRVLQCLTDAERNILDEEERFNLGYFEVTQKKTYEKWVNLHLVRIGCKITDLYNDFCDGKMLLKLLEILSGLKLPPPERGSMRIHCLTNVDKALNFLYQDGIYINNIGAHDIVDGNRRLILGLVWVLILHYSITDVTEEQPDSGEMKSGKDALLLWCQKCTADYPNISVQNFTNSWRDGLAFNALIHRHRPDLIQYDKLEKSNPRFNLENAFTVAKEQLNIAALLDPQDVDVEVPDDKAVMTYVVSLYEYFTNSRKTVVPSMNPTTAGELEEGNSLDHGKVLVYIVKSPGQKTFGFTIKGDDIFYINTITPGSPAEECGLRVDDRIIEVNGEKVDKDSLQQVVSRVKEGGSDVRLFVEREAGTDNKDVEVESSNLHAQIEDPSLSYELKDEPDHTGDHSSFSDDESAEDRCQFTHTLVLDRCAHEGRVWEATQEELQEFDERFCVQDNLIGEGGFGQVYSSPEHYKDWKIRIAVKKMKHRDENESQNRKSILNEILAARIKHFSIVPLLMKGFYKGDFYFVFPLYDGNLLDVIQSYNKGKGPQLRMVERYRILYQVASCLEYMHTEVKNTRYAIIHGDLTTKNIVLDSNLNAHILDFGLARNLKEGKKDITTTTSVQHTTPAYWPKSRDRPSIETDWYQYGVVLLELLTGSAPVVERFEKHLKDLFINQRETFDGYFKTSIKKTYTDSEVKELTKFSDTCFKFQPVSQMIGYLKAWLENSNAQYFITQRKEGEETKCVYCKINAPASEMSHLLEKCNCHNADTFKVCIACLRKSFLNPLMCFCGKKLKTTIGDGWAAILISGTDTDPSSQGTLNREVDELGDIMTSKHPFVMGIREENLFKFTQHEKTTADSLEKWWKDTIQKLSKQKITTLLFYYTGHNSPEEGFQVGSNTTFRDLMQGINSELNYLDRIIFILDCCYAEHADIGDIFKDKAVIRLNSSRSNQTSKMTIEDGSYFTKYLKQALGGTVWTTNCQTCQKYPIRCCDGVIDSGLLTWYLGKHLRKHDRVIPDSTHNVDAKSKILGYFIDFNTKIKFCLSGMDGNMGTVSFKQLPKRIENLLLTLFERSLKSKYSFSKELIKSLKSFSDTVYISVVDGPRESNIRELKTLNEIQTAWDQHLPLYYDLRNVKEIKEGRVMLCLDGDESPQQIQDVLTAIGIPLSHDTPTNLRRVPLETITSCEYMSLIQASSTQNLGKACKRIEEIFTSLIKVFLEDNSGELQFQFLDSNETKANIIILKWLPWNSTK